jgi:uncharacterized protein DUF4338
VPEGLRIRGRDITPADLDQIRAWLAGHPDWSRRRLSLALAQHWNWRSPTGQVKDIAARDLLNRLAAQGLITLPARQRRGGRQTLGALVPSAQATFELFAQRPPRWQSLSELRPLSWHLARAGQAERGQIARYLATEHYLGYPDGLGQLHYLVRDRDGQDLAVLLFGPAAWKVATRDAYLGWSSAQRQARLGHLANNSRFLILPGRHARHLASHLLAQAVRHLRSDWPVQHGLPLLLVETFVESERFSGTSYRAANWIHVGQTQGRTRNDRQHQRVVPRKEVYVLPLCRQFRQRLSAPLL